MLRQEANVPAHRGQSLRIFPANPQLTEAPTPPSSPPSPWLSVPLGSWLRARWTAPKPQGTHAPRSRGPTTSILNFFPLPFRVSYQLLRPPPPLPQTRREQQRIRWEIRAEFRCGTGNPSSFLPREATRGRAPRLVSPAHLVSPSFINSNLRFRFVLQFRGVSSPAPS